MSEKNASRWALCAVVSMVLLLGGCSAWRQEYLFRALEPVDLFLFDSSWMAERLARVGGLSLFLSSFCTQFFRLPGAGALVATLCYAAISLLLYAVARRLDMPRWMAPLTLFPPVFLFLCLENNHYRFFGHIALLLAVAAWWGYDRLRRRWPDQGTAAVAAMLLGGALYEAAGSVALLFACAAVGRDLLDARRRSFAAAAGIAAVVLLGAWHVWRGDLFSFRQALAPSMYYTGNTTGFVLLYGWISVLLLLAAVAACRGLKWRGAAAGIAAAVCAVAVAGNGCRLYGAIHSPAEYRDLQARACALRGDWKGVLTLPYGASELTPYLSYRHLALAHCGKLIEALPVTHPDIRGFLLGEQETERGDLQVRSAVFYDCNYLAAARKAAFEANLLTPGLVNGEELLRLIVIDLAFGDYALAEKLIAKLEQTLFYRGRASAYRRLLYDDAAVDADAETGPKRHALPRENHYLSTHGTLRDLEAIVAADPGQSIARQFYTAYVMLVNDRDRLEALDVSPMIYSY